jgi:hypothetical protein
MNKGINKEGRLPPLYRAHPSPTALPQARCLLEIEGFAPNYRSEQPYSVRSAPRCRLVLGAAGAGAPIEHCERCGCRGSHLGSNHNLQVPKPPEKKQWPPGQQSSSLEQNPLRGLQHLLEEQVPLQR